ncbi:hypothetical protein bas12_0067 [Escherichia phage BrunoManser]|uniref:Uncharacterized protein n=1 Tax=Escherichia phage BrunoManser TaxID=2851976 RepID=A0AAE7VPR6_9CAUD|nr:hypothetical protein bas12_0067 [Escherichia phage BrunoManser]
MIIVNTETGEVMENCVVLDDKPKRTPKAKSGTYKKVVCKAPGCGNTYEAKVSDLNRGWGMTCCKSCAAVVRELKKKGRW